MSKPTRVEAGRRRAQAAKRALTVAATTGFVIALALARQGHPARASVNSNSASQSGSSSSSVTRDGFEFEGGSIEDSPSNQAPSVATSTS
jgi:hypothetical protein